jgi:hypothetical protein
MSETTICRTCNAENPQGSKYCNHCGAILPPSTNIICPNCRTANPRNRLYCDECGTRLVKETPPPTKPAAEEQPSLKRFDLPSRAPGDTSDLDPMSVPDWLRTGQRETDDQADIPADIPSNVEEEPPTSQGEQKPLPETTDALPSWLLEGNEDVDNLFGTPREITTDHYLELLQGDSEDEAEDLTELDAESETSGWLTDPNDEDEDEASGWLTGPTAEAEEEESWLEELGPAQTGIFSDPHDPDGPFDPTAALPNLPDWLTDIGPAHTGQLGAGPPDDDEDWLDEFKPAYTGPLDDTETPFDLDEFAFTGPLNSEEEAPEGELPDWLLNLSPADSPDAEEFDSDEAKLFTFDVDPETVDFEPTLFDAEEIEVEEGSPEDEPFIEDEALLPDEDSLEQSVSEELDWLAELEASPPETAESADTTLTDLFAEEAALDFTAEEPDNGDLADEDTWLEGTGEFEEFAKPDRPDEQEKIFPELEPVPADESEDESLDFSEDEDLDLEEIGEEEEIPEWISQLGPPTGETGRLDLVRDEELARNEELPEWITDMMPASDHEGLTLSGLAMADADYHDPLEGIPEELASAELPDWLQDAPPPQDTGRLTGKADTTTTDIPGWLQQGVEDEETARLSAELSDLLGPPTRDRPPKISKADIPEWLQALKPAELTGVSPESQVATSGPLSGIQGALEIEPLIAKPRMGTVVILPFSVSKEQQQQVELLQQVIAAETETQPAAGVRRQAAMSLPTRIEVALLLLLAVILGLWGPAFLTGIPAPAPEVTALHTAVESATGQPVLLVFDYTPALAGELDPQAELLLQQLAGNGSPVVSLSQYTTGARLADLQTAVSHPDNRYHIGYLPGEAIGVRQLGTCLAGSQACNGLVSRSLSTAEIEMLADVSLVIILTGERDNLVNWIEQLAVYEEITLAAGVTQGLRPVAAPYVASGQLVGLLTGIGDVIAYQQSLLGQTPDNNLIRQQNAQSVTQLMAALLLLVGLVAYARRT